MNFHTAKLVSITPDAEKLVAYCARVSNPANQDNHETAPRLLKYLIKHRHWSPFEMANMVVEIKTNRGIAAQILRHRSFSFQEFSQRYAAVLSFPQPPKLRRQDAKNKQNSIDDVDEDTKWYLQDEINELYNHSVGLYEKMLDMGIAKECAREVLPIGSETTLYMNGTLRSWLHYIDLRAAPETQLEHRMIAESVKDLIEEHCPAIYEAMWS
jgi:thymidylate synthase (FAD)